MKWFVEELASLLGTIWYLYKVDYRGRRSQSPKIRTVKETEGRAALKTGVIAPRPWYCSGSNAGLFCLLGSLQDTGLGHNTDSTHIWVF